MTFSVSHRRLLGCSMWRCDTRSMAPDGVFVAALTRDGAKVWRTTLAETGAPVALTVDHTGEIWAQGLSLTRLDSTGAVAWAKPLPVWDYGEIRATALAADGSFFHFTAAPAFQLTLEAINADGSTRWSTALGGNTNGADLQHRTIFEAPVVTSSGIKVSCQPHTNGVTGIARLSIDTGALLGVVAIAADAQAPTVCDRVVADDQGNFCFGAGGDFASGDVNGLRWTSAQRGPALVGTVSLVVQGLTELSFADGSIVKAVSLPDGAAIGRDDRAVVRQQSIG